MSLRKKMLLTVGITLLGLWAMIFAVSSDILKRGFAKVEDHDVRQKLQRLQDTIAYEINNLSSQVNDWAVWDEAYSFIGDGDPEFVERNLPDTTYSELRLNLVLFLNIEGELVFGTGFDLQTKKATSVTQGVLDHIATREFMRLHLDRERSVRTGTAGVILLPEGPMFLASRAILPTGGQGSARGLLIMGRAFDEHQVQLISSLTHLTFSIHRYEASPPALDSKAPVTAPGDDEVLVRQVSDDIIAGYGLLRDAYGKPALLLHVEIPRKIHRLGETSVSYLMVSVLLLGFIFLVLTFLLLERLVLCRVLRLDRSVKDIAAGADPSMRVVSDGSDEIASLAANINKMLTALEESQRGRHEALLRFESVIQNAPLVAIQGIDRRGVICHWNNASASLYGYAASEAIGMPYQQVLSSIEAPGALEDAVTRVWDTRTMSHPMELTVRPRDGGLRWVYSSSWPLIENGTVVEVFRMDVDITERKRAEDERMKMEGQLFHVQKIESVGRLAGGVAHDFNNMLGVIIGHCEMALELLPPEQPLHQHLSEIQKAAERSADLTRQLLAFARKQTVRPKVLDLNDIISGMLKMLRRLIGEDIDLVWSPGHETGKVKVDPSQIDQVLVNLVVNARDAISGAGTICLKTENAAIPPSDFLDPDEHAGSDYVLLSVRDNGQGMDRRTLDRVFEPFFTTKEMGRGTGLGLATVYGIVKQNCGYIHVESEPGMGATFRIYLPRYDERPAQAMDAEETRKPPGGKETILLVEDDKALLTLSKGILESLGYTVLAAPSPKEGMRLAEDHPGAINLLVTDVVMPEMNGLELAARIDSIRPGLKCLYTSGYTADMIAHRGILDEHVHFIPKPFRRIDLAGKVREVLEGEPAHGISIQD